MQSFSYNNTMSISQNMSKHVCFIEGHVTKAGMEKEMDLILLEKEGLATVVV